MLLLICMFNVICRDLNTSLASGVIFYPMIGAGPAAEYIRTILISLMEMNSIANLHWGKLAIGQEYCRRKGAPSGILYCSFHFTCSFCFIGIITLWKTICNYYRKAQSSLFQVFLSRLQTAQIKTQQLD